MKLRTALKKLRKIHGEDFDGLAFSPHGNIYLLFCVEVFGGATTRREDIKKYEEGGPTRKIVESIEV